MNFGANGSQDGAGTGEQLLQHVVFGQTVVGDDQQHLAVEPAGGIGVKGFNVMWKTFQKMWRRLFYLLALPPVDTAGRTLETRQ